MNMIHRNYSEESGDFNRLCRFIIQARLRPAPHPYQLVPGPDRGLEVWIV